jgi:hypothetical protein
VELFSMQRGFRVDLYGDIPPLEEEVERQSDDRSFFFTCLAQRLAYALEHRRKSQAT